MFMLLGIFFLILSTNYLIHFLEDAASGAGSIEISLKLLGLMVPQMVGVLLPISLFLAILTVLGKLFSQNELLIVLCAGVSFRKIWAITQRPTLVVVCVIGVITLFIEPLMSYYQNSIRASLSKGNGSLSLIQSGDFVSLKGGSEVVYLGGHTKDNALVSNVFLYFYDKDRQVFKVVTAPNGHSSKDAETDGNFMVLENGHQYQGNTQNGEHGLDYNVLSFKSYGIRMPATITPDENPGVDAMSLWRLFHEHTSRAKTEIEWRFSVPIVAWVLALFAVGLSYVKPRQGRFGKFLPALLIFMMYFNFLVASRAWTESGSLPPWIGLWWVHLLFALVGLGLLSWRDGFGRGGRLCVY
jgi:lipopolysaccharide export system permease protein